MSEWQTVTIDEICKLVTSGGTPLTSKKEYYHNGNISWVKTKEVNQCRIYGTENHITQLGLDSSSAKLIPENSIIIAMYGDGKTAGRVALNKVPVTTNQACCNLVLDPQYANYDFVFYNLMGRYDELVSKKTGSGQQNLNGKIIKEIEIDLPPLPEQKTIASVLSSLDDKINLLHRQNKTLEAMAETLFRQWFIEEAKEDWKEADMTQLISLQSGYAFKSKDFQESGNFGVIKIKNISGNIIDIEQTDFVADEVGLASGQRFHVTSGQVLVAMTGAEIGKLGLVPKTTKKLLLNQRVGLLEPNFIGAQYLAYLHLQSEFGQDYIENSATGSAQPNISGSLIEACPFPKVEDSTLQQYGKQVQIYFEKVIKNLGQIQTLEKLRDTLLPKLMSGEVRVQYQTEEVA